MISVNAFGQTEAVEQSLQFLRLRNLGVGFEVVADLIQFQLPTESPAVDDTSADTPKSTWERFKESVNRMMPAQSSPGKAPSASIRICIQSQNHLRLRTGLARRSQVPLLNRSGRAGAEPGVAESQVGCVELPAHQQGRITPDDLTAVRRSLRRELAKRHA